MQLNKSVLFNIYLKFNGLVLVYIYWNVVKKEKKDQKELF